MWHFFSSILVLALTGYALSDTQCSGSSKGWHKFGDYCYLFQTGIEKRVSYYDAEDFCRSKGAHLVSILSQEENDFIKDTIASHSYYYGRKWIGLNILDGPEKYQWSDGNPFSYKNIIPKQQYKKESCFILYGKEGGWRPDHCGLHYTPLCKRPDTEIEPSPLPPFTPKVPEGNCESDWIQFGQKCYKFYGAKEDERLKFKEALSACMSVGADHDLVSIHSIEEQAFLTQRLNEFGTSAWIGIRYIENDEIGHDIVFGWTDNSRENFTFWAAGEPPSGTWKYCGYLNNEGYGKGQWKADNCDLTKRGYVCQKLPDPAVPKQPDPVSKCQKEFVGFKDSCYQYFSTPQNWNQAEVTCQKNGGHLLTVNDAFEQNFVYGFLGGKSGSLWTGLRNVKGTRIFKWSNGEPLYYSNWEGSQPDIKDLQSSCVSVSGNSLEWRVEACSDQLPFICEVTEATPPDLPKDVIGDCPSSESSWIDIGDKYCYLDGQDKLNSLKWGDNSRYCMSKGLEMISLSSEHQMKSLFSYLWKRKLDYWLALIRSFDKESFIWVDGSSLSYTNWANNEPSARSRSSEQDCVQISMSDLKWYPKKCDEWSGYLCRAEKTLKDASVGLVRSVRSYTEGHAAAPALKEAVQASHSSGAVSLLIAAIVCLGLLVLVTALVFAWKRRNDDELPTVLRVQSQEVSSNATDDSTKKY